MSLIQSVHERLTHQNHSRNNLATEPGPGGTEMASSQHRRSESRSDSSGPQKPLPCGSREVRSGSVAEIQAEALPGDGAAGLAGLSSATPPTPAPVHPPPQAGQAIPTMRETDARGPRRPPRDAHTGAACRGVRSPDRSGEDPALDGNGGAGRPATRWALSR